LINRAISVVRESPLHITIASGGLDRVLIQLEDDGASKRLGLKHWQQLQFWVEELGGAVERESEGLMWTIRLPLDATAQDQVMTAPGDLSVLVASADTDVRAKVIDFLRGAGHGLVECRSQDQSIEFCRHNRFDLVLLDSDLPGGGGVPLARALNAAAPDQTLIALMSTGIPRDSTDFQWVKLWMHKPPRENELQLALNVAHAHRDTVRGAGQTLTRSARRRLVCVRGN
jgi:CheY-like chemotaxis protein